jgi:hypothetical protein
MEGLISVTGTTKKVLASSYKEKEDCNRLCEERSCAQAAGDEAIQEKRLDRHGPLALATTKDFFRGIEPALRGKRTSLPLPQKAGHNRL